MRTTRTHVPRSRAHASRPRSLAIVALATISLFTSGCYNKAYRLPSATYPTPDGPIPGGGSIVAGIVTATGQQPLTAGKPYAPIYEMALARAKALRNSEVPLDRVLAIGDSVRTDLTGATALGVDCLFLTGGIHAGEIGGEAHSAAETVTAIFRDSRPPKAAMRRLVW